MKKHAAPIIAAILLILPVLYVGSYLALVVPGRTMFESAWGPTIPPYRWRLKMAERIFWPLEQIDRKVRPRAWEASEYDQAISPNRGRGAVQFDPTAR
jgi:hypothetical protein